MNRKKRKHGGENHKMSNIEFDESFDMNKKQIITLIVSVVAIIALIASVAVAVYWMQSDTIQINPQPTPTPTPEPTAEPTPTPTATPEPETLIIEASTTTPYIGETYTLTAHCTDYTPNLPVELYRNDVFMQSANTDANGYVTFTLTDSEQSNYYVRAEHT